ncbi:SRPBCC family protein [Streptomyces sp. NA02950]|uniref:SRPBCC family protein n=1 Tax=Streptomyces sp. NA02950 TaxID=2742137 RepID=UPI0015905AA2|nr:SRPBCC family protein [Streptomyces sp. NA02950]QKV91113.1 SRPBCC family protein [Streptomyces sp. NA02950]
MAQKADERGSGGLGALAEELPTDRLKKEARNLLGALGQKAVSSVTQRGKKAVGKTGDGLDLPMKPLVKAGLETVKDKAVDKAEEVIPGLGGGKGGDRDKKLKVTNIVEQIDVGAPVSLTYDLWTQFEDFPSYMKKVEDVSQESDTELDWKAQVFWSHRKWHSEIVEQVPDKRIIWTSRAEKGHVNGAVTFHEIAPELTRILLVLQYYPQGFFERTGNIWRAQGRRARLELKHFRRHLMAEVLLEPDEIEGWRGEIREGEVVDGEDEDREDEDREDEDEDEDEEIEDAYEEDEEDEEDEGREGGEDAYDEDEDAYEQEPDEDEEEAPRRSRRR